MDNITLIFHTEPSWQLSAWHNWPCEILNVSEVLILSSSARFVTVHCVLQITYNTCFETLVGLSYHVGRIPH